MRLSVLAAAGAAALFASAAHAQVVLSDNFNNDTPGLNSTGDAIFTSTSPAGNTPNPASIDIIGSGPNGTSFDLLPGNGYYVDLDGTSGYGNTPDAGQLTSVNSLAAGTYKLTFDLAGNQRGAPSQTTDVTVGSQMIASLSPLSSQNFMQYSYTFTTTGGNLQFTDIGPSSQQGSLLDNVEVSAAPEPATWALMMIGLGGIGLAFRQAKRKHSLRFKDCFAA